MPSGKGSGKKRRSTAAAAGVASAAHAHHHGGVMNSSLAQSMIGKKRKQMRVFLGELLDNKKVDGLYWEDKDQMLFRMPWKHAKKKDYDVSKDAELIKLWAINTGRYGRDGQEVDPTTWKINFRCALNSLKQSIVEVETNEEEDYRRYRFDDSKRGRLKSAKAPDFVEEIEAPLSPGGSSSGSSCTSASDNSSMTDSPMSNIDEEMDCFASTVPSSVTTHTGIEGYVTAYPMSQSTAATATTVTPGSMSTTQAVADPWAPDHAANQLLGDDIQLHQLVASLNNLDGDSDHSNDLMENLFGGNAVPAGDINFDPNPLQMNTESGSDSGVENDKSESLPDCFEVYVKVCYRGSPVAGMKVDSRHGCRIFFGPCVSHPGISADEHDRLFGSKHLTQLSLPAPSQAQSILPSIWYLLDCMQRGVLLEVVNNDIWATRLCNASVYWGAPAHEGDTCALERGVKTRIFNYQLFLQIYKHFRDDPQRTAIASQPPTPNVLLSIGQPWGPHRMLDNNLVVITITHCLAEHLMELLHRHRWEQHTPFDTDYLMIDPMDDDDKLAVTKTRHAVSRSRDERTEPVGKLTPMNLSALPVSVSSLST